jgi:hypothetical protein
MCLPRVTVDSREGLNTSPEKRTRAGSPAPCNACILAANRAAPANGVVGLSCEQDRQAVRLCERGEAGGGGAGVANGTRFRPPH